MKKLTILLIIMSTSFAIQAQELKYIPFNGNIGTINDHQQQLVPFLLHYHETLVLNVIKEKLATNPKIKFSIINENVIWKIPFYNETYDQSIELDRPGEYKFQGSNYQEGFRQHNIQVNFLTDPWITNYENIYPEVHLSELGNVLVAKKEIVLMLDGFFSSDKSMEEQLIDRIKIVESMAEIIDSEITITENDLEIFDLMMNSTFSGKTYLLKDGEIIDEGNNRYYITNSGWYTLEIHVLDNNPPIQRIKFFILLKKDRKAPFYKNIKKMWKNHPNEFMKLIQSSDQ